MLTPSPRRAGLRRALTLSILAAVAFCGPTPAPARAEEPPVQANATATTDLSQLSLEDLMNVPVTAAALRPQAEREAAASVSVVTAEEIELFGYRNLADVLRNQRSFYLYTDGLNWLSGVRGFLRAGEWNARMLVLVDGRPTREDIYGETHLDQDFVVPIEAIKRVEIIRGPGSALYGSNAVFATVNVVTLDGADLKGGQVRVQGGTQDTARVSALYGTTTRDGWDLIGGFAAYTSQGTKDVIYDGVHDAAHDFGHVRGFDYEGADAAFFKARKGDFTAEFDYETRNRDNRSATYLADFNDPGAMHEDRWNATFRLDHQVAEGQSFHALAYYGHYAYKQQFMFAADPSTGTPADRFDSVADDDWLGQKVYYDWQVDRRLHLLAGAEANEALYTHQHDHDTLNGDIVNVSKSYNSVGVFAEAEWKATGWLTFVTGGRVDQIQDVGTEFSPRAAAIVTPNKADTYKLLYGRAFRQPNIYEMFYTSPGISAGNPNLKPEEVDTYELVYERQFASGWRTSVGGFYWRMANAMDNVALPDGTVQTQNIGTAQAKGVEVEVQRRWATGATARAYATYTRAEDPNGGRLTISPEWIFGAALALPVFNKRTFISIDPQFVGPMHNDLGQSTDATFVTNAVFTARDVAGVRNLEFQVGAYNLFANGARFPHGYANEHFQPFLNWPRTQVLATLTYRF